MGVEEKVMSMANVTKTTRIQAIVELQKRKQKPESVTERTIAGFYSNWRQFFYGG